MNDILACIGAAGVFFGAIILRGIFGYLKNKKIEDVKFDIRKFLLGSIKPILLTLSIGALAALLIAFAQLVNFSGVEVAGLDQLSVHNLLVGLFIADVGALGYAIKEALLAFGLSDKQIMQIRESAENGDTGVKISVDENGDLVAGAETITEKSIKEIFEEEGIVEEESKEIPVSQIDGVEFATIEEDTKKGEEGGKGAAIANTYPEPYRSARKDSRLDPSTCYNRECVSYCAWKICEVRGSWPPRTGNMNAKEWIYRLPSWGYRKVSAPRNGGKYVGVLTSGRYGHVVWFEGGNTISEYNYGSTGNFGVRNISLNAYIWYEIKAPSPSPTPGFLPAKGYWGRYDKDERINRLSIFMRNNFPAYTPKAALGPVYGNNLWKSIKEFQRRTGLQQDGNTGPITYAKLRQFGFKG